MSRLLTEAKVTRPRIIAVAGNMGAGKSSLVYWLQQQFGMMAFFEPNEEKPLFIGFLHGHAALGHEFAIVFPGAPISHSSRSIGSRINGSATGRARPNAL